MSMEEIVANLVQRVEHRFYGKYRGFVVDNGDPENLGRLKVTVPSVLGPDVVTGWAWPCTPYGGGAGMGFLFIPEKEAGVWVEFEEGDPEFPIWVGTFWSKPDGESELPKPNKADGTEEEAVQAPPTGKIIKTRKGHTIQLEDADDKETVTIVEAKNKHVIVLDKEGIRITDGANKNESVWSKEGIRFVDANENQVTLDDSGVKIIDSKNNNTVTMESGGITITDKNNNDIKMAGGGVTIKDLNGNQVKMEGAGVTVVGTTIKIGNGASHPIPWADMLNTQLTTFAAQVTAHVHVGNLGAPTGPPVPPPQLVLAGTFSPTNKTS